jgi:DNA uptake protein ComE-like DNA-binding protein
VSGGAAGGAPRAAAVLALLALAHGAEPAGPDPGACPQPRLGAGTGLAQVSCAGAERAGPAPPGAAALLFGRRLDPNVAPARALEALPGIGPARAAAIARAARVRAFCAPEDLERVPGIGPVGRARLAGWIEVGAGACAK